MNRKFSFIAVAIFLMSACGCQVNRYAVYQYDNGDDYFCEGLHRIVDSRGKIGFADEKGRIIISPRYAFAFPFENGVAKATYEGHEIKEGEHSRWISPDWFYIDHRGARLRCDSVSH